MEAVFVEVHFGFRRGKETGMQMGSERTLDVDGCFIDWQKAV